jgi:hypothetical protein
MVGGELRRAGGYPPHIERFEECGFNIARLLSDGLVDGA